MSSRRRLHIIKIIFRLITILVNSYVDQSTYPYTQSYGQSWTVFAVNTLVSPLKKYARIILSTATLPVLDIAESARTRSFHLNKF